MKSLGLMLFLAMACPASVLGQIKVDVELVLAIDVSGSMSYEEHVTQRRGFLAAFADPELLSTIESGVRRRIAVTYIEWAGPGVQRIVVPWHIISNRQSAMQFRSKLRSQPRSPGSGTSISSALLFSAKLFHGNGISSFRQIIDITGDGHNRSGPRLLAARDHVLRNDIVINGLPIMLSPVMRRRVDGYGLDQYFKDCVIGGASAFVYPVLDATEFGEAIRRKLILEIADVPSRVQIPQRVSPVADRKIDCEIGRLD